MGKIRESAGSHFTQLAWATKSFDVEKKPKGSEVMSMDEIYQITGPKFAQLTDVEPLSHEDIYGKDGKGSTIGTG